MQVSALGFFAVFSSRHQILFPDT